MFLQLERLFSQNLSQDFQILVQISRIYDPLRESIFYLIVNLAAEPFQRLDCFFYVFCPDNVNRTKIAIEPIKRNLTQSNNCDSIVERDRIAIEQPLSG